MLNQDFIQKPGISFPTGMVVILFFNTYLSFRTNGLCLLVLWYFSLIYDVFSLYSRKRNGLYI